ncbi:hypothetical protein ORI20_29000 [Mycobacterium sp. CVI_P3]|uniref:Uncharacterized protein n=1 Tax=Mycobacterium pinniadriaticum TaxID=2994102 RepID=A0ABT3SPL5_9MYCO|nr:hypothetical protein [Mycobacterium pinniadriaticum]MCX2934309.1 hypothetical protein [Mycobacterium pinniadriaticum]MCX2940732.1 hypothetical protein [Mycobacterium pinniadriaticum]
MAFGPSLPARVIRTSSMQIPGGIYAPFLHPWSAYNVMLMHTVLP